MANGGTTVNFCIRNADLSFSSKYWFAAAAMIGIDADANNIYSVAGMTVRKWTGFFESSVPSSAISSPRMIDFSGDPDYGYVTSNNATDGHGVRKIRKSDMTVVASLLATGAGDGQFQDPLGIKYYNGYLYVVDLGNKRVVKIDASGSGLTWDSVPYTTLNTPYDIDCDGTYWYMLVSNLIIKKDINFANLSPIVQIAAVSYSICIIPDQGDGYGQTLAITDNTNSHLARYKCSDLSLINEVGSAGDGVNTLCDPQVTGPAGTWRDSEGNSYAVASAANISKNGLSGDFFRGTPNRMTYRPTSGNLSAITAIDANADGIVGEIKNLYRCSNLTSLKLQTNPALVLDLSRLSAKLQALWAYACGAGIYGSIRHMTALSSVNLRENGASQAQVDQWIGDLYANKDIMAPGTANFNGTNSAPSTAGKAQADELVADYAWTITYSA